MINTESIKTVIVDLDRTLLHTDKTLSVYTEKVLEKCKSFGIKIMVATARPLRTTLQYYERIKFDAMVVSNGARVVSGDQQMDYGICQRSSEQLLNVLNRHPSLLITLETGDMAYSNKPVDDYETVISENLVSIAKNEGVLKILVQLDDEKSLAMVEDCLTDDLYYTISNGRLIQIMDKSATKWNGIKTMLARWNCSPNETVYFGDDNDDIEPIKMCGLGIAVSNSIDEVKAVADHITESNDADGVAKFIEQQLLKNPIKERDEVCV